MNPNKLRNNIIETILVKGGILILNFAITFFIARLWKAEGKGVLALFIANLGIVAIFCNVFTSSSVSFYLKNVGKSRLFSQALIWVTAISAFLVIIVSFVVKNWQISVILYIVSVLLALVVFNSSIFLGKQKIKQYNLISLLQPLLLLIFMLAMYYCFNNRFGWYAYLYSQIASLFIVLIVANILTNRLLGKNKFEIEKNAVRNSFNFGWKTELSNLLQFMNYRFSMYVLGFLSGISSVGVFSIGIAISEAIWIFSRSISVVQYSNVLDSGDTLLTRKETTKVSLIALYAALICVLVIAVLPSQTFVYIFGSEFTDVKKVILFLSPGIIIWSLSAVYGNFFSAIGKLRILVIKSTAGLLVTLLLSFLLIPKYGLFGACFVNTSSYIVSSVILIIVYFRNTFVRAEKMGKVIYKNKF